MPLPQIFANVPTNTRVAGSQLDLDLDQVGTMGVYPCTASAGNNIALVPFPNLPTLSAYADYQRFSFVAASGVTGPVTLNFAGLGALPWYAADGITQLTTGQVGDGEYYDVAFIQALNSGAGGFISAAASSAPSGPVGPHTIELSDIVQVPAQVFLGNPNTISSDVEAMDLTTSRDLMYGTPTPGNIAGAGISVTGTFPTQTIAQTGTGTPLATGQISVEGLIESNATILQSLGIASVTNDGPGLYTVNFSSAFDTANYACAVSAESTPPPAARAQTIASSRTANSIQVQTTLGLSTPTNGNARFSIIATGVPAYHAAAVHLDGSTWLNTASLLTGVVASPDGCGSFWMNIAQLADLPTFPQILSCHVPSGFNPWGINIDKGPTTGDLTGGFYSSTSANPTFGFSSDTDTFPSAFGIWVNVLWSVQTNHAAAAKIVQLFFNDSAPVQFVVDADASFSIDWNEATIDDISFFTYNNGDPAHTLLCDVADFWFAPGQFIDFTSLPNRRKFISSAGKPVFLGNDGSLPTGTAPAVFFTGNATNFGTNVGSGGVFATTGTITNAATSPSD